jgi:phosphate:Na+ symporter
MVSGVLVFLLINVYLDVIQLAFGPELSVGFMIAIFHTMKKLTGLFVLLPLTGRMVAYLERKFVEPEARQETPRYLDDTVLHTPSIAVSALVFELKRVGRKTRKLVRRAVHGSRERAELDEYLHSLESLNLKVADFIQKMQRTGLPPDMEYVPSQALRVLQYFREAAEHGLEAASISHSDIQVERIRIVIDDMITLLSDFCRIADSEREGFSIDAVGDYHDRLETLYDKAKRTILDAGSRGEVTISRMMILHDLIRHYRRITDQLTKAATFMDDFNKLIEHEPGSGPELQEMELEQETVKEQEVE